MIIDIPHSRLNGSLPIAKQSFFVEVLGKKIAHEQCGIQRTFYEYRFR